jgi:hypothetical protein
MCTGFLPPWWTAVNFIRHNEPKQPTANQTALIPWVQSIVIKHYILGKEVFFQGQDNYIDLYQYLNDFLALYLMLGLCCTISDMICNDIPWSSSKQCSWFGRWCVCCPTLNNFWRARWKGECGSGIQNKATFPTKEALLVWKHHNIAHLDYTFTQSPDLHLYMTLIDHSYAAPSSSKHWPSIWGDIISMMSLPMNTTLWIRSWPDHWWVWFWPIWFL